MSKPYKSMYVLPKETYKSLVSQSSPAQSHFTPTQSQSTSHRCSVCGRDFKNSNILAHHLKSHVDGFKCNICGKVFMHKSSLHKHLKEHGSQSTTTTTTVSDLHCPICNKRSTHKRNLSRHIRSHASNLKFKASKWETLK